MARKLSPKPAMCRKAWGWARLPRIGDRVVHGMARHTGFVGSTHWRSTTWTPKMVSIALGSGLVRPCEMTEYMMNSSGSWSSSGRQPANGLMPRSLNSSCWPTATSPGRP